MTLVSEAMNRAVVAVAPEDSIELAEEIAKRTGAAHLLVLDEDTLVGILCACDLQEAGRGDHVCDRMSLPVLTVRPDIPLEEAANTLGECDLGCLPVALGGLILGTLGVFELERAGISSRSSHGRCHRRAPRPTEH